MSSAPDRRAATSRAEGTPPYEFSAEQNQLLAALGQAMHEVGRWLGCMGILSIIAGVALLCVWAGLWERALGAALWSLLLGGVLLTVGVWTRDAGEHFRRVASTIGADIEHLMEALREMRYLYGVARLVVMVALVLLVLAMLLFVSRTAI
jgi:hypothetical protein